MVNDVLVKFTIDTPGLAEVIIDVVMRHHSLSDLIVSDQGSVFTSVFWSSLCYLLGIKRRLSTAFHPQTDGQTERQNSTIEAYLRAFVNYEQNDGARLLPIVEFVYNNAKNVSTSHTLFELNCGYHPRVFYEEEVDPRSQSKSAEELATELKELVTECPKNLYHAQELQKRHHDENVKLKSYAPSDKVCLNSKYIKTKRNRKLEAKFFGPFRVLYPISKLAYKIEISRNWRIHDVFHLSLLEKNTDRKGRVDEVTFQLEFVGDSDGKEYKVEAIQNRTVYAKKSEGGHLPGIYYLVSWKSYPEEENTWESASVVYHLGRLVSIYHEEHLEKSTTRSPQVNSVPPMTRPTVKLTNKRKRSRSAKATGANKCARKSWGFDFYLVFGLVSWKAKDSFSGFSTGVERFFIDRFLSFLCGFLLRFRRIFLIRFRRISFSSLRFF